MSVDTVETSDEAASRRLRIVVEHAEAALRVPSVTEQPEVVLYNWEVHEMPDGRWLLSGCLANGSLRTSTPVVSFRARTGVAVTESGRVYRLHGHRRGYGSAGTLSQMMFRLGIDRSTDISERVACTIRAGRFGRRKSQGSHRSRKHRCRTGKQ